MSMETLLHDEIEKEIEILGKEQPGGERHKAALDSVTKLLDRMIEIKRIDVDIDKKNEDNEFKWQQMNSESDLKIKQLNDENKDRKVKNVISITGIAVPVMVTIWGSLKSWEFEKEGTITSTMGRGFIGKLLPKK